MSGVVIVGGGLAGQRCAETLRRNGYEDRVLPRGRFRGRDRRRP
jgi:predicted NAD/FAD-dependent oxidoreductase